MPVPFVLTCLGNIGGAVLGKVGDYLVAPIQRQFKYMCCFDSNITELEAQLETFQRTRQGLQLKVDNDRANVRIIDPNVEAWLRSANEVTSEVEAILTQEKPKVKEGCLNGLCPNLKLRYSLSKKAVKKTEFVDDLQKKVVQYTQISYNPPLPSLETIPSRDLKGFESRWFIMEEIIKSLKHDEINLIGVCGMAGVGKTTMVNEVAKRAKEDNDFDEVAMADVGQEPNLTNVQACIAKMLGLELADHKDSPIVRSDLLHKRLLQDNKKILVILDDIWAEFDLQRMGIPLGGDNKNLKMLYTSRIQDLWHERRTKKEIPLELLSEDEAWQLFKEKVGDSADAPSLQHIAKQIVKKCGRLPLALVLIGSALSKSKGSHIQETWEDMLYRLNSSSRNKDLSELLETSYKYLEYEEAKRLFLLCCLFKEDKSIRIEDLARYAFGLSIFDGIDEITKARHRVVALVSDLKGRYLLLECKDMFLRECVKVHDVVRNMGITIASRDKGALVSHGALSKWPRKNNYEHYTAISVISEKIKELPGGLTYPNLEFLMLQSRELEKLPPYFFERMEKLKVLVLEYFHGILTFQPLRNLTTLSLEGFGGVLDNVCAIGDLVNLEILSFRYSEIKELPEEIGKLVNLRLLDLDTTRSLKRIPQGVISRLERLEELYICDSGFKNWEGEGKENANLRELESLSNLNTLEICLLSNDKAPIFIPPIFGELKMYKLVLMGELCRLPTWEFKPYKRLLAVSRSTPVPLYPLIPLLRSSDGLFLDGRGCNDLVRELLLRDGVDGLQQLKHLKISSCDTPECLANTMNLFPILEKLHLWSLSYLRQICRGPVPTGSFRELTTLDVNNCGLLENLFELPIGGCFAQLKILTIRSCIMMKEVFRKQQREDVPDTTQRIEFPKLETLKLEDLPSLVGFCGGIDQIDFPKLKRMDLKSLGKFKRLFHNNSNLSSNSSEEDNFGFLSLFPQKVSLADPTGSFREITELKVENCELLENLFELPIGGCFAQLQIITIKSCIMMKEVFRKQQREDVPNATKRIEFPKLENLVLKDLPSLVGFGGGIDQIDFPKLKRMLLKSIGKLKCLFHNNNNNLSSNSSQEDNFGFLSLFPQKVSLAVPTGSFRELTELNVENCELLENLFELPIGGCFAQLQILTIKSCIMMKEVFGKQQREDVPNATKRIEFPKLETLELEDLPSLVGFGGGIDQIDFPKLQSMDLKSLGKFKSLFHNNSNLSSNSSQEDNFGFLSLFPQKVSLPNLKVLIISKLENLETLGDDSLSVGSLSKLEVVFELEGVDTKEPSPEILSALKVKLCDLPKLIYISKEGPIGFKYIQTLEIKGCHSLRYVFAPTVMKSIPQLHELKIRGCEMLSRIVAEENGMGESSVGEVKFPHLERLELHDLPNLVSLFPNVNTARPKSTDSLHNPMQSQSLFNEKVVVPSLKYLKLLGLENVSDLWCSELPSSSFSKLEKLEVITCASLRTIFHPSMSGGLVNLKELLIEGCLTLEGVIGKEEDVGGGHGSKIDKTLFPLLGKLKLASLPNLKRFCNSTHPLELPKLSQMDKLFCPSMDAFSSEPVFAPNLTLPGISWNGDLNNAIQFLQKDDVPCLIVVKVVKSKYSNRDDPMARSMGKLRTLDDVTDNFKTWQVADTQCHMIATPDSIYEAHKVARLLYTNSGNGVLALGCNGIVTWWKMGGNQHNQSGMATASVVPDQWQPPGGLMTNDVTGANIEEAVPCIALSKNGYYVVSACGGKISLFNVVTFKVMTKYMPPSPASTFLAFYPQDNNVIAMGMEDSTIRIYNVRVDEVICILKGHQNRITGLAFSTNRNILVSSGADAQLCIWSIDTWKKMKSVPIQLPACKVCNGDTSVEFHSDLIRLLVSHETQLAIYDASKMDRMRQWVPQDVLPAPIFCAAYSCDSQLVYTSFCDGNIGVFDADSLTLQSRIAPSAYLSPTLLSGSQAVCLQFVLAAHPHEPNQFAIGLTDGFVKVMEPPESEGNRGSSPHVDNEMLNGWTVSSSNTSNHTPDQKGEEDVVVVDEDLDEDVDEDALITTRTRTRTATTGTHDEEEDLEEKRKKYEEERKKKKGKAPLLDDDKEY